jgi:signal transduction histidine kinase
MAFRLGGRLGLKAKQVIGVTAIVALAIAALTSVYLALIVRVWLTGTEARGELVAWTAYQRAFAIVATDQSGDLGAALRADPGLKAILEASLFDTSITFAAFTDAGGVVMAHNDPQQIGRPLARHSSLQHLIDAGPARQLRELFRREGQTYDVEQALLMNGGDAFGTIHVGVSTLLIRGQIEEAIGWLKWPVIGLLIGTFLVAILLANLVLRPIAVISSRVAGLGRGEFDSTVELPDGAEFRDVSESIKAIGARLAAGDSGDARQLVALSRLNAGIAHEIKNPLNAMSIHLELLRAAIGTERPAAEHLSVITGQLRRLDEVVQTFLKFSRPEQLTLTPTSLVTLFENIRPIVEAEAEGTGISVEITTAATLPDVRADQPSLQNAILNLALNACQAMPNGGTLRIHADSGPKGHVAVTVVDTGVGIPHEQLDKIFNLYFTTKADGTGIGLAMVYRTVQMHDGTITVESAPGRGTTFTMTLWAESARPAS